MPKKEYISSHAPTTESHVTVFPPCKYFASSNSTVKNKSMFVHSVTGKIQFQSSLHSSNPPPPPPPPLQRERGGLTSSNLAIRVR